MGLRLGSSLHTLKWICLQLKGNKEISQIPFCIIPVLFPFPYLSQDYMVNVTEEFLEFISDGALAIEVWGHRCTGNGSSIWEVDSLHAKTRTLHDRCVLGWGLQARGQGLRLDSGWELGLCEPISCFVEWEWWKELPGFGKIQWAKEHLFYKTETSGCLLGKKQPWS